MMSKVAQFQEFPAWSSNYRLSGEQLAEKYEMASDVNMVVGSLGAFGSLLGGAPAVAAIADSVVAEGLAKGSVRAAARVGVARAAGVSAGIEQTLKRLGLSGARGGAIALALAAIAGTAYVSAAENVSEIEKIAEHRLRDGSVTSDEYQLIFPKSYPGGIRQYWRY